MGDPIESSNSGSLQDTSQPTVVTAPSKANATFRVLVFSVLLAAGAAGLLVWGPVAGRGPVLNLVSHHPAVAGLLIITLLIITFAAVVLAPLSVHYRGQTYMFGLSEVPLLLGLVFAAPAVLVVSRMIGEAFAFGAVRRQSPLKAAFNLSSDAMSTVIAIIVYQALLGSLGGAKVAGGPLGWAAGAVALSAAFLYGHVAVAIVVRLHGYVQQRKYGFEFTTVGLVLVSSIALALVVLDAASS
ncbi:MAG TPA: hypothetical protein VK217_05420, partial [Acidimicrobiales bacterium]|nr:hypothetical protein [Acidimicrobiales bacterium]